MAFNDSETVIIPADLESMRVSVDLGAATHQGNVRANNEDSFLVVRASRSLEVLQTNLPLGDVPACTTERAYGIVVADGMGGHAAGEVASQLALRAVLEHVLGTADWIMRDADVHGDSIEDRINERFEKASASIAQQAKSNPRWAGMGTTMTLAMSIGNHLFLGHIGDSRAYLWRGHSFQLLTRDHSFAQTLADTGTISQEQVAVHRLRHVLLRSLGSQSSNADVRHLALERGDQLLLCTDGLTNMVAEPMISSILQTALTAQVACDQLIAAALAAGGNDNVTAVLAKYNWT